MLTIIFKLELRRATVTALNISHVLCPYFLELLISALRRLGRRAHKDGCLFAKDECTLQPNKISKFSYSVFVLAHQFVCAGYGS
jgi:hypothetical protein